MNLGVNLGNWKNAINFRTFLWNYKVQQKVVLFFSNVFSSVKTT